MPPQATGSCCCKVNEASSISNSRIKGQGVIMRGASSDPSSVAKAIVASVVKPPAVSAA